MASTFTESFEGPNGVTVDTSNTAFTQSLGTPPTFSTAQHKDGASSAHFPAGQYSRMSMLRTGTITKRYWSFYIYPVAYPSGNTPIFFAGETLNASTRTFQLTWNSGGNFKIQREPAAIIIGSNTASTAPLNEWSRVDLSAVNGFITMELYPGNANCDNPVGTAASNNTAAGQITPTAVNGVFVGGDTNSVGQYYLDAFREDDAVIPGPVGEVAAIPTHFRLMAGNWVPYKSVRI